MAERTVWDEIKGGGSEILHQARKILEEGNARRVVIKQKGRTVAEFPLTIGVVGAVLAPVLAAIGALVALLSECSIGIERVVRRRIGRINGPSRRDPRVF